MIPIRAILTLLILFVHSTSGEGGSSSGNAKGQNLILLLIDGYGAELFNRTNAAIRVGAETLLTNGVHAKFLQPVFPTQSYPNWYSLSTGKFSRELNKTFCF